LKKSCLLIATLIGIFMFNVVLALPVFADAPDKKVCVLDFKNLSAYNGLGLQAADAITADIKKNQHLSGH